MRDPFGPKNRIVGQSNEQLFVTQAYWSKFQFFKLLITDPFRKTVINTLGCLRIRHHRVMSLAVIKNANYMTIFSKN